MNESSPAKLSYNNAFTVFLPLHYAIKQHYHRSSKGYLLYNFGNWSGLMKFLDADEDDWMDADDNGEKDLGTVTK